MSSPSSSQLTQLVNNLNNKLEPKLRYPCLTATTVCATVGAVIHITDISECGLTAALGSLTLIIALHFMRADGENFYTRLAMLLGFGFCSGQTLGPLPSFVIAVNARIVVNALFSTCNVFVSFSLSALLGRKILSFGRNFSQHYQHNGFIKLVQHVYSYFLNKAQLNVGLGVMSAIHSIRHTVYN